VRAAVRTAAGGPWIEQGTVEYPTGDVVDWTFHSLDAGVAYEYRVYAHDGTEVIELATGRATTQRPPGEAFTFSLVTDTHIPPRSYVPLGLDTENYQERTLLAVAQEIASDNPDFIFNLGDMLDFHMFGFNEPPPDSSWTRWGYLNYRRLFGQTLAIAPHFAVIGNWDGENGCNGEAAIERSRSQRLLYVPGPRPETYPESGNVHEDYYAFTWGDALFVVLNVMTYTAGCHYLSSYPGLVDDWTLGESQLAWLRETLKNATSKWRFLVIHHAVGGAAGDMVNATGGAAGKPHASASRPSCTTSCSSTASKSSSTATITCSPTWSSTAFITRCPEAQERPGSSPPSRLVTKRTGPTPAVLASE
jgi:hypothetical protein